MRALAPGVPMHVIRAGRGAPPLVFVHGFACTSADWEVPFALLQAATTVVACDLRGHGASPGEPAECSIEQYGADVASLLAELDLGPAVLVGHSMGCRVVLECCRSAPARVSGVVLVDGSRIGAGEPVAAEHAMREQLRDAGYERFMRGFFEEMFVASGDPGVKAAIIDRSRQMRADAGRALLPRLVGWDARDMEGALDAVRVPMMVIQTTTLDAERRRLSLDEDETSSWLELVRQHVPGVRVEILPGLGHFPHVEAADSVSALIADFIASDL
jgi:pimeloyl-ACP methyl ester carboxylesterase